MNAGAVAGLPYGLGVFTLAAWAMVHYGTLSEAMSGLPPPVSAAQVFWGEIVAFSTLLIIALILGGFLGSIVGWLFVKSVNRIPVSSVYVKAVGFGFLLWLFSFLLFLGIDYTGLLTRISLLFLPLFLFEGATFAYLFNRWRKPPVMKPVKATWLDSILTLRRVAVIGATSIVAVIVVGSYRMVQMLPKIQTDLTTQIVVVCFVGVSLFLIYGLIQIVSLLRRKKQSSV